MTRSTPPKHTIFAILSVIESGKAQGDPGAVTMLAGYLTGFAGGGGAP